MLYIPVLLGSTRKGRQSPKVAAFVLGRLQGREEVETELLDLLEYDFPIMEERLRFDDEGRPADPAMEKRADKFLAEVIWFAQAVQAQKAKEALR